MKTPKATAKTGSNKGVANLRPWRPGQSGNPSGRPKIPPDVREAARALTADAIQTLGAVMRDSDAPPSARVSAACALLDRGWGRPESSTDVRISGIPDAPPIAVDITPQEAYLRMLRGDTR